MQNDLLALVRLLSSEEYRTAVDIAEILRLSDKTVRNRLKELSEIAVQYGVTITVRPRYGYLLQEEQEGARKRLEAMLSQQNNIPDSDEARTNSLIAALLNQGKYIRIEDLSKSWYISRTTLQPSIKAAEHILTQFDILLERRPRYGMRAIGSEFDIRRCLTELYMQGTLPKSESYSKSDIEALRGKILELIRKHRLRLTEDALDGLAVQIYVAMKRIQQGFSIKFEGPMDMALGCRELQLAEELAVWLAEWGGAQYDHHEIRYIAIYLAGIRMAGSGPGEANNFVISSEFDLLVLQMLTLIYEEYHIDLRNNFNLRMALNQHLVPFDFRMRYKMKLENPILEDIQANYAFAYVLARRVSELLKLHYKREIPDNEVGYLAMLLAFGLEQPAEDIQKARILIVCGVGRGSSRILRSKYQREFGDYLSKIYVCGENELPCFDFGKVDYVFSTVPITQRIPVPIVQVGYFLGNEDHVKVKGILRHGRHDYLDAYYREDNFFVDVPGETNEEVIRNLCAIIQEREMLPEGFVEAVLKREQLAQTDFGNRVAIPHPYRVMTDHTFVYVAILKKEILWSKFPVQLVILSSVSDNEDNNLQKFYDVTSKLLGQREMLDDIIHQKQFSVLMEYLNELSKL